MARRHALVDRYRSWLYPLLATFEPERSHHLALRALALGGSLPDGRGRMRPPVDDRLGVDCFGLHFANPLGMAAGFDKDAKAVEGLLKLGFGCVEVGTVTPRPQFGNPPPRVWRFPGEAALINALGFPSAGAAEVRQRLAGHALPGIVGINLGKNRNTPSELASDDFVAVLESLWDQADYFTLNVSSPNTPGLRELQRRDSLNAILRAVMDQNVISARLHGVAERPVLVKIAPDLSDEALDDVLGAVMDGGASGVIVANTTTNHSLLGRDVGHLPGGLSGRPIRALATDLVRTAYQRTGGRLPIVGVGGIESAEDVIERMRAGASLVQLYTAFVYGGPALPRAILGDLIDFVDREGLGSISEIVGTETARD